MKTYILPAAVSAIVLVAVFLWGGFAALWLAITLSALEVMLSFDNAVVNAKVLERMSARWQQRFLTWGILIAVFGTRLVLPVLIVAIAAAISPIAATVLAVTDPDQYALLIEGSSHSIAAFGGAFLLLVSLKYFFDTGKNIHWIDMIESRLSRWGRIEAVEIGIALLVILILSFLTHTEQGIVLAAGVVGILLFVFINGAAQTLSMNAEDAAKGAAFLFLYLNVLDAAFSLDGVIGAFALTTQIFIIVAGLGIGALFVRTITVHLVRKRTLETLVYLEHGAHWAIFGLALFMFADLVTHVPSAVVGFAGVVLIGLSYYSSLRRVWAQAPKLS
ncbi:MAG: DUF475 domain-containing protein [Patescibacteria group bacterium]|nr:DUF475 domain-containing protein [Patescibacteria group bacterium]